MRDADILLRFLFEHNDVRGEIVHLDATWQAVRARGDYPAGVRTLLGEALSAAALLTSTLKLKGSVTLQARGDGPVSLLVVQCSSERTLRGLARYAGDVGAGPITELMGEGRLAITIDPVQGRERFQGIVDLAAPSLSSVLENYFAQSEQLPTRLWLAADERRACGMLLQRLPGREGDEDDWTRIGLLASTLAERELLDLPASEVLRRLFHEDDVRVFEPLPYSFRCTCSRDGIEEVLRALGYEEARSVLAEQGRLEVTCEFCNQAYVFDPVDVERLFAASVQPAVPKTRH